VACALWESPLVDEKIWDGEGNLSREKKKKKKEYDHPQRKRKDCLEAAVMSIAGSRSFDPNHT
jgi:hypothetical protein